MKKPLILAAVLLCAGHAFAQINGVPSVNWQNLDLQKDGYFGISTEKMYDELLKGKPHQTVIVAVIDGGIDINQEDLKPNIWTNPKDTMQHGWNFLGSKRESFEFDNNEVVRLARTDSAERQGLTAKYKQAQAMFNSYSKLLKYLDEAVRKTGKTNPTADDFKNLVAGNEEETRLQLYTIATLQRNPDFSAFYMQVKGIQESAEQDLKYHLNIAYDPRAKYSHEFSASCYGNTDVIGPVPALHGTHVAGIIAAVRENGLGINGVANDAVVLPIRAIPDGEARDQDIAVAIRYAVDHGAKVINMSFDKYLSPFRSLVDEAVKYAMLKDVLIIHSAGNDAIDADTKQGYPNKNYADKSGVAEAWIEVGASGAKNDERLIAPFSNYGQRSVDAFAPGEDITSTLQGNKYEAHSGTSMAAPVVAGLAAVIRGYYPRLTAKQVKDIILISVTKIDQLKDKCVSGGVVNAFNALKLAANYKERNK